MKKGCFIKVIIIITILTAVVVYILQNHFRDFIFEPGKKVISSIMMNEFDEKLAFIHDSPEKDSLKIFINSFILHKMDTEKDFSTESITNFLDSVKYIFRDSIIDKAELEDIKNIAWSKK